MQYKTYYIFVFFVHNHDGNCHTNIIFVIFYSNFLNRNLLNISNILVMTGCVTVTLKNYPKVPGIL